jgi:hypothetical protein
MLKTTPLMAGISLALGFIALPATVQAETERQLGAHDHGAALLTLAGEGQTLVVGLDSPAYNLVGFEQTPGTDAQRAEVAAALGKLAENDAVVRLPSAAACALESHQVEAGNWEGIDARHDEHGHDDHGEDHHEDEHHDDADEHHEDEHHDDDHHDDHAKDDHGHDDDHGHAHDDDHEESAHSDVLAEWTYRCENPGALQRVTVSAFEHFPNLTDLQVQYIGDDWQGAIQLTPANTQFDLD